MSQSAGSAARALSGRFEKAGREVQGIVKVGNVEAGRMVAGSVAAFLGGPRIRLRGVGKAGATVGVQTQGGRASSGAEGAIVRMTGPAQFIERDTPKHLVGTEGNGDDFGSHMAMPDGRWATGPFMAGGSTGRHPFQRGVESATPAVPQVYRRGVQGALRRTFKG